ncbi:N-acetyltransferase [Thalassotalea insulae]|uniref:N-acetyltransferase n=1 Tax=Thalassotalea insulae TaxID=2056778 RepID=A0ABQ6GP23_9GAMM|nr:GNAT family protein [Thalassotalea insulae]GLX77636.1 N-acetyltransferase [Thalassotalea insulae]
MIKIIDKQISEIYLQEITLDDISSTYVDWLNDSSINQFLETRFQKQDITSITQFVTNIINSDKEFLFTIRLKKTGHHIGNIKIGPIYFHHGIGDVSLFIGDKNFWGLGFANKAIKLISQYAFEQLKLRKLMAYSYKSNIASIKAFLKAGYLQEGVRKLHYIDNNGIPNDLIELCYFNSQYDKSYLNDLFIEKTSDKDN